MGIVLITASCIVNFIINAVFISMVNERNFERYDMSKTDITYKHTTGKETNIIFGEESVKVGDSYTLNRKERLEILCFIRYCLKEKDIDCNRTVQNMEGEMITHNLLYKLGYKPISTKDTDIDYKKDKRWYVNTATVVMQILGL